MPLDFTPYLLSASPPASSLEFHNYGMPSSHGFSQRFPHFALPIEVEDRSKTHGHSAGGGSLVSRRKGPLKSIIIRQDGEDCGGAGDMTNNQDSPTGSLPSSDGESNGSSSTPTSPTSPGRLRKRVSFADTLGKPLTEVRLMRESSDEPPRINPQLLACITQGATAQVTDKPPLKLAFAQPACDYLAFRENVDKNCVSLENVLLNDYTVQGTIKVKNIGFEKSVFVRWTTDFWETFEDNAANYVPGPGDVPGRPSLFDTFEFQFEVPTTSDTNKNVQFAVCFRNNEGGEYWDNNNGSNYVILWEKYTEPSPSCLNNTNNNKSNPFFFGPNDLADFACWNHVDNSLPYY
jgi:protein phosphatase 1 regulatory subunit 3A/B/C/D/E